MTVSPQLPGLPRGRGRAAGSRATVSFPAAALPEPVPLTWPMASLAWIAAGVLGFGAAPLLAHRGWAMPVLVVGLAASAGTAVFGERARRRAQFVATVAAAMAVLLGTTRGVRADRWRGRWVGTPRRLRLSYAPQAPDADPDWLAELLRVVAQRTGTTYRVRRRDPRRCLLVLREIRGEPPAGASPPPVLLRAERTVRELLGPTADVTPQWRDDELVALEVDHEAGVRVAGAAPRARIERAVSTMLPGRWRALWQLEDDFVRFEQRPALPTRVEHPVEPITADNYLELPYAQDEDGRTLVWSLRTSAGQPHLLPVGSTGSGKTVLINGVVFEGCRRSWEVYVCDPKRIEFLGLRQWPNVRIVATSVEQMVAVVHRLWRLMEDRYALVESGSASEDDFEPVLLVLDEYRDFVGAATEWYARIKVRGMPSKCPVFEKVSSLARKGRSAHMHLVLGTQRPDAEWLSGEALAIDTPIPTPHGWATMGEVKAGDWVLGAHGRPVRVSAVTDVAQGRPCYRIIFSDGATVVTDAQHLWSAASAVDRAAAGYRGRRHRRTRSRFERWPGQADASAALDLLDVGDAAVTSVPEFEADLGLGRIPLLRRVVHEGRQGLVPVGVRPGVAVRFVKHYRYRQIVAGLRTELESGASRLRERQSTRLITTEAMTESLHYRGEHNWSVPVTSPLDLPDADLPIDPWLLGYWLGDCYTDDARIATADPEVLDRIRGLGYGVTHHARFNYGINTGGRGGTSSHQSTLKGTLRDLGVLGNKHVPMVYLRASAAQRAALLAGLLDSAGTCGTRRRGTVVSGQVSFTNADRGLVDAVAELATSFGFITAVRRTRTAGIEQYATSVAFRRRCRDAWTVRFTPDRQVFGIARKQAVLEPALAHARRATTRQRYIVAVEPVESVPVRCITVDSPDHLYLCGRAMIPTHNCRDNFRARVSLGRLSPQGAVMMWDAPHIGVSLPRRVPGRATAEGVDDRPVEAQTYWTPDPRRVRPDQPEDLALLQRLRPTVVTHPPLVVVPPGGGEDAKGNLTEPGYYDWAEAPFVPAADRPDLAPPAMPLRDAASTGAVSPAQAVIPDVADVDDDIDCVNPVAGYGPGQDVHVEDLQPGDLVLVDETLDQWAVVEAVEPDLLDDSCVCIDWRGDEDEMGALSLPERSQVSARRPLDLEP